MVQKESILSKFARFSSSPIFVGILSTLFVCSIFFTLIYYKPHNHYAHHAIDLPELSADQNDDIPVEHSKWVVIKTHPGDTLGAIFSQIGIAQKTLQEILQNNPHKQLLVKIKTGLNIRFLIEDKTLQRIIMPVSTTHFLIVSHEQDKYITTLKKHKIVKQQEYITATIKGSLYNTAKRQNIPYKLIQQMTEIFNREIDFSKEIKSGDQFSIMYEAEYIEDKLVNTGDIIAVSYNNNGKIHQAVRYQLRQNDWDYFTPQGNSLKKAFSRYPVRFSHINSSFSLSRYHPVLHYRRPHKGIDLAAPIGTPVYATGAGRIQILGYHNGYGNMIQIAHDRSYSSLYAHLLKFQKGLKKGQFVKKGEVIGYVGQTGLASGPHCHYEFHVNRQPRNPATIDLPTASPVPNREKSQFKARAGTLLAQLKLFEEAHLAAANTPLKHG